MFTINHFLENFQGIVDLFLFCMGGFLFFLYFVLTRRLCEIRQALEQVINGLARLASEQDAMKTGAQGPNSGSRAALRAGLIPVVRKPQRLLAQTELLVKAVPAPKVVKKMYIAKGGENIGEIDMMTIKKMVQVGQLSLKDYFFENHTQKWSTIDCLPGFS